MSYEKYQAVSLFSKIIKQAFTLFVNMFTIRRKAKSVGKISSKTEDGNNDGVNTDTMRMKKLTQNGPNHTTVIRKKGVNGQSDKGRLSAKSISKGIKYRSFAVLN